MAPTTDSLVRHAGRSREAPLDSDFIAGLLRREACPHPVDRVELVETHISWVLLTGEFAYKVKKPVKLGFLDFRELDCGNSTSRCGSITSSKRIGSPATTCWNSQPRSPPAIWRPTASGRLPDCC